ncbi:MAG: penicillin-binding transpeptidase domain-containing protein, partial [Acidimicrobiales bacterium]
EWEPNNYFIEEVRRQLLDDPRLGETREERAELLFGGGLRVYTTYDPVAQAAADAAVARFRIDDPRFFVAALAAVEPGTGEVRAIVGGPGFDRYEFNIATQKGRPTGSSFKAFVLAAAMEKGMVPSDIISGTSPCKFDNPGGTPDPYTATNFEGSRGSTGSIRSQTLSSSNCGYLRLGQIVGLSNVADTANALGVTSDLSSLPISMPLGPLDVTPLDMATAYATFANDGLEVDPIFIRRVEDRTGNVILVNEPDPQRAISVQSARLVTSVLEANVRGVPAPGRDCRTSPPRQDRYRTGLQQRVVRRVHALPRDRRVVGESRRSEQGHGDAGRPHPRARGTEHHGRLGSCRDLAGVQRALPPVPRAPRLRRPRTHEVGEPGQVGW